MKRLTLRPVLGSGRHRIRFPWKYFVAGNTDGTGTGAKFDWPIRLAIDGGDTIYVADRNNARIHKITPVKKVTTIAGSAAGSGAIYTVSLLAGQTTLGYVNATGSAARFDDSSGVALDNAGSIIVADRRNHGLRKVTTGGAVTPLAGNHDSTSLVDGTALKGYFNQPYGVTVASDGSISVTGIGNYTVRRLNLVSSRGCLDTRSLKGSLLLSARFE